MSLNKNTILKDCSECIEYFTYQIPQELQNYRSNLFNYLLESKQDKEVIDAINNKIEENNKLLQFNSTE